MAKKPAVEKYIVADTDVELTSAQLYAEKVPCRSYIKDANGNTIKDANGDPTYDLYFVNIVYKDFADLKARAIEKTKHAIGQEIKKGTITEFDGLTVDSSGKPPKSALDSANELAAAVKTAKSDKDKKELKALLTELLKDLK